MEQQLKDAARVGDVDVLCDLVCREPNILEEIDKKPFADTPLHEAASHGQTHFALLMIELKPSFVRKRNQTDRFTPLHVAVQCGKTETVIQILNVHSDGDVVRVKGKGDITPLHCAVQQGNIELLLKFLWVCPKSIEDVTLQNETCLHLALKNQQLDAFKALVGWMEIGYEEAPYWEERILNWKDDQGNTILEVATSQQLIQDIEALLTNSRLAKYFNPPPLAVPVQQLECSVSFLNEYKHLLRIDRKLNKAAYNGESDAIYAILREDEHILNNIDKAPFANTPLHIAALKGHSRFVEEIMMLKPAFAKKLNRDGFSPLHLAIQNQEFEVARKLVRMYSGELVSVKGRDGMTPLHCAIKMGNEELVAECLIACPKSIEDVTFRNENVLHLAVKHGELACLKVLCRWSRMLGGRVARYILGLTDDEGNTPKDIADTHDNSEIIQFLKQKRAPNRINSTVPQRSMLVQRLLKGNFIQISDLLHQASFEEFNIILVVSTLIATTTYQAVISPPGSVWQGDPSLLFPDDLSNSTVLQKKQNPKLNLVGTTVLTEGVWVVFATLNTLAFTFSIAQICIALWGTRNMLVFVLGIWILCYAMALYIVSYGRIIPVVLSILMFFCYLKGYFDVSPTVRLLNSRNMVFWLILLIVGFLVYIVYVFCL